MTLLAVTATVVVAGCTGGGSAKRSATSSSAPPTTSARSAAAAAVARTDAIALGATRTITVAPATLTAQQSDELRAGVSANITEYVGQPVELGIDGAVPADGIRLARTYATAVPAGLAATLAFFDPAVGDWQAVPSALSSDRRTVYATVHHLSVWTDIVGTVTGTVGDALNAVQDFGSRAADWAYHEVGKVFDTRVDPPSCTSTPSWVKSTSFLPADRNNSLLFCTGHDPAHPQTLVVKARVNRGFAFTARVGAGTAWRYNSTSATAPVDDALTTLGHLDDTLSRTFDTLEPSGEVLVGAGKELDLGFTEQQIRDGGVSPAVVTFAPPTVPRFIISLVGALAGDILSDAQQGYTAAAIVLAGCYDDLHVAHDVGTFARAATSCLTWLAEHGAGPLGTYLTSKKHLTPEEGGKLAGKLVARITVYLALVGPVFSSMNFAGEQTLPASSRTVTVFPTLEAVTAATLRSAQVPAYCNLPAQRLINGVTTHGSPGGGGLNTKTAAYADFAGLGYRQALTEYGCTAGGVGWPDVLVLIGTGGRLLGSYRLGDHDQQEHSTVSSLVVSGNSATVVWDSYEGAGFDFTHHRATVRFSSGRLQLDGEIDEYTPQKVLDDIFGAQLENKRSELRDPDVVTDDQWSQLTGPLAQDNFDFGDPDNACTTSGDTAVCTAQYLDTSQNEQSATFTLTRDATNAYGWVLTDIEV